MSQIRQLVRVAATVANWASGVAKIEHKNENSVERSVDRKKYAPPKLREFGPVGALTQAGTAGKDEKGRWA